MDEFHRLLSSEQKSLSNDTLYSIHSLLDSMSGSDARKITNIAYGGGSNDVPLSREIMRVIITVLDLVGQSDSLPWVLKQMGVCTDSFMQCCVCKKKRTLGKDTCNLQVCKRQCL